jgi:hypothetical protein
MDPVSSQINPFQNFFSSRLQRRVVRWKSPDVSEEIIAYIVIIEE